MTKAEYTNKLKEMVLDINPAEIAGHIENDSLSQWIQAWASEMLSRIDKINLISEIKANERTCELVKIVPIDDIGRRLTADMDDNQIYFLDKNTMTICIPWASAEFLYAFGLEIVKMEGTEG